MIFYGTGILLSVAVGALIMFFGWWRTDSIVSLLIGETTEDRLVIDTSNVDLHKVLINFIGIFLLVSSVPYLLGHLANILLLSLNMSDNFNYLLGMGINVSAEISDGITQLITFFIGLWLVF